MAEARAPTTFATLVLASPGEPQPHPHMLMQLAKRPTRQDTQDSVQHETFDATSDLIVCSGGRRPCEPNQPHKHATKAR
jgi:hypothetical protein